MTLSTGSRLGPYEILSPIGAGGMGEVYRARDTRLDRTVAVKVLPQHLSSSPEVRQRFEREAKTISQLSHPHICALYDVGNQDGVEYLVMEYLEGETLAERLVRGALPLEQTLRCGIEVADALDKAHRQGIVHRDLKPGNVMLTKSGVKLLDFGLAKAVQPVSTASALTSLPTEGPALTAEGTILGTFQYMSPEQLEGAEADARTDIFAFGAVLYEMTTARKAFTGKSRASLIGAILKDEPPAISTIQAMAPPALDRVVRTCLAKDPEDRWQTARDLTLELKWIAEGGSAMGIAAPAIPRARRRERLAWALAALFGIGLAASLALPFLRRAPEPEARRALKLSLLPPEKAAFAPGMIALSRDGSRLAFVAEGADGKSLLRIRPLDSVEARPLPGTEGAYGPFWSWDGRFLGFFAEGSLKKIEASGGPPQTLYNISRAGRGGTWNRDGVIVFAPAPVGPLLRILDTGGAATPVTNLDEARQENSHRWPVFLPDGRHFLYYARSRQRENRATFVGSLDSKETRVLMNGKSNVLFAPDRPGGSSYLLFEREGWLVARKLGFPSLRFESDPIPIAEGIQPSDPVTAAMFTVSETGVLAYGKGAGIGPPRLAWFDRSGKQLGSMDAPGHCTDISLSPDQKRVAVDVVDLEVGGSEIWQTDLTRGVSSRLTIGDREAFGPVWSPDGERIVFSWFQAGSKLGLYEKPASGAGKEEPVLQMKGEGLPLDWSADGRYLLFETRDAGEKPKLWILPLFGERKPLRLLGTPFSEDLGAFSPDGKWIAYVSDESGRREVYVQTFPISTAKWRISTNGGTQPRWRGDGKEIFYVAPDNRIMAVAVKASSSFEVGIPTALFQIGMEFGTGYRHQYAVTRDGERFLVIRAATTQEARPITVVLNWESELKK